MSPDHADRRVPTFWIPAHGSAKPWRRDRVPKAKEEFPVMQIGAMNHPAQEVLSELRWMAELGLEFIDLTIEPPAAAS